MEEYEVSILIDAGNGITVKAESPEHAAELAYDSDKTQVMLCHHCSSNVDIGDCTGVIVYDAAGKEVYNDTWYNDTIEPLKAKIKELEAKGK